MRQGGLPLVLKTFIQWHSASSPTQLCLTHNTFLDLNVSLSRHRLGKESLVRLVLISAFSFSLSLCYHLGGDRQSIHQDHHDVHLSYPCIIHREMAVGHGLGTEAFEVYI